MEALISGRGGTAIIIQLNGSFKKVDLDGGSSFVELDQQQAWRIYSQLTDWIEIEAASTTEVLDALTLASCESESLDCCLALFDTCQSKDVCSAAAELLEGLLELPGVQFYLEDIFFAKPLPANTNEIVEVEDQFPSVKQLINKIYSAQSAVRKVREAWTEIPFSMYLREPKTEKHFESACLRNGIFRKLVDAFGGHDTLNSVQLSVCEDERLKREFPGLNMLMNAWVEVIRKAPGSNSHPKRVKQTAAISSVEKRWGLPKLDNESEQIDLRQHSTNHQAFTAAISMVDRVVELVKLGKDSQADDILNELIAGQLGYEGGASNAMRSLCNIAGRLRKVSRQDFAIGCLNRAIDLSGDARAYQQLGAVLIDVEHFEEAEKALKKANELASAHDPAMKNSILCSIAHLHESRYQFDRAFQIYDTMDPVFAGHTQNLRADTLRKMGCLEDAMDLYVGILSHNKTNDRAFAGKAEIAKRRGNPHKGIRHYRHILTKLTIDPDSKSVYQLALGNLFKMTGQIQSASKLAMGVLSTQPYNTYAALLLASAHGLEGNYDKAIGALPQSTFCRNSIVEAMLEASRGNIEQAKENLGIHLTQTHLLLEDQFFLRCSRIALSLATEDVDGAKQTLAIISAQSMMERDIESVFQLHVSAIEGTCLPTPVRSRRLVRDWHRASGAILSGNFQLASRFEFGAILKCA